MPARAELRKGRESLGFCDVDETTHAVFYGATFFVDTGASNNFVRVFQMSDGPQVVGSLDASA